MMRKMKAENAAETNMSKDHHLSASFPYEEHLLLKLVGGA